MRKFFVQCPKCNAAPSFHVDIVVQRCTVCGYFGIFNEIGKSPMNRIEHQIPCGKHFRFGHTDFQQGKKVNLSKKHKTMLPEPCRRSWWLGYTGAWLGWAMIDAGLMVWCRNCKTLVSCTDGKEGDPCPRCGSAHKLRSET